MWWSTVELTNSTEATLDVCGRDETLTVSGTRVVVECEWCFGGKDAGGELQFLCLERSTRNTDFASGVD